MMEGRVDTLRPRLTLYDLVLLATLAVVFGFLYWALVQVWGPLRLAMGPLGDLAQNLLIGGWFVVAPLAIYIVRKPLVGVTTEILASIVEVVFLGSPVGPILLLTGLVQGAGSELPFAITRYRRFEWGVFAVSGLSAAVFSFVYNVFRLGWLGQDYVLLRLGFQLSSGILLGGILAKIMGDALLGTGVLDNYAIGRAAQS
jgi:energy-coupling factor transport system substrate-specific component